MKCKDCKKEKSGLIERIAYYVNSMAVYHCRCADCDKAHVITVEERL